MSERDQAGSTGEHHAVHESWLSADHPLHRPRHSRRQRTALTCALTFFMLPVLVLALGVQPAEFENRRLTSFPGISEGWGFATTLPAWASDHLPFRDVAIRTADGVSRGMFGEPSPLGTGGAHPSGAGAVAGPVAPVAPSPGAGSGASGATGVFPQVIEGDNSWLYFGYDVQAKCAPVRPLVDTLAAVDRLRGAVEASGRRFVLVVPPDKSTAEPDNLPDSYPGRDCARRGTVAFWQQVRAQPEILDLRGPLNRLSNDAAEVYHPQDTHWTDLGAITMTRRLAERIQPRSTQNWVVEAGTRVDFDADLPRLLGRTGVNERQQYSLAPDGTRDRTGPYALEISAPVQLGSGPVRGVVRDSVCLLGDSFTQSASRYLAAAFADIEVVGYGVADPVPIANSMVDSEVVVLEVVERNLASGTVPLLQPGVLDGVVAALDANPVG